MQNKLIPILAAVAIVGVVYIGYKKVSNDATPGIPLKTPPKPSASAKSADSDTPADTLRTLTSEIKELKTATQQLADDNNRLKNDNAQLKNNETAIVDRVSAKLRDEMRNANPAPSAAPAANSPDTASGMVDAMMKSGADSLKTFGNTVATTASDIPGGLGYDSKTAAAALPAATAATGTPANPRRNYLRLIPMGMTEAKGASGQTGLVKTNVSLGEKTPETVNSWLATGEPPQNKPAGGDDLEAANAKPASSRKKTSKSYFTIPENATLANATAMTAIVGRVPVDGRVQDPMQFKLLIGRENLAANGQSVPDDIAGMIVSGIAIGDMTLMCSEGAIQSLTFIFNDGTIRTVSRRRDGAMPVAGGSSAGLGGGGQGGMTSTAKLGYLSDEYGNPCITGKFVTNAPAFLTNVTGLKTLSLAASAAASAQTTTVANGTGVATGVTGNKNTYVLGQAAGGAIDEVSNWVMRRLNNSFDAVVTPSGGRIVVHIEQEITLDKEPDARRLDYANLNGPATSSRTRVARYGLD